MHNSAAASTAPVLQLLLHNTPTAPLLVTMFLLHMHSYLLLNPSIQPYGCSTSQLLTAAMPLAASLCCSCFL
jgi:hypothetical protein